MKSLVHVAVILAIAFVAFRALVWVALTMAVLAISAAVWIAALLGLGCVALARLLRKGLSPLVAKVSALRSMGNRLGRT
jgi:hypothetical protein